MIAKCQKRVGKMTGRHPCRHKFDASRRLKGVALGTFFVLAAAAASADSAGFTPTADIEAVAAGFVREKVGSYAGNTRVVAAKLDSRLRLAHCDQPLEAFLRPGEKIDNRTNVGVRCSGASPWKVYIPVDMVVTKNVLMPRQSVSRGHILTENDLVAVERDVTRLRRGYFTDKKRLVGQKARQSLVAGQIITPSMIEADTLIRRGQTVTLSVANNRLNIQMAGKALSDGALHQRIRVENTNSGRVVEGVVRSREHVEVIVVGNDGFF